MELESQNPNIIIEFIPKNETGKGLENVITNSGFTKERLIDKFNYTGKGKINYYSIIRNLNNPSITHPYLLSKTDSIQITDKIIKINDKIIEIANISAFRMEAPQLSLSGYTNYSFGFKCINANIVDFKCQVKGEGYIDNSTSFMGSPPEVDIFKPTWKLLLKAIEKFVIPSIINKILNQIYLGEEYTFGKLLLSKQFRESFYMRICNKGVFLKINALLLEKDLLIPWSKIEIINGNGKVQVKHKLKLANNKTFNINDWNIAVLPAIAKIMLNKYDKDTPVF